MFADPMGIIPVIFTVAQGPTHTRAFPWVGTQRMGATPWSGFFARAERTVLSCWVRESLG